MSWFKRLFAAPALVLGLAACGFEPIARPISADQNIGLVVRSLTVNAEDGKMSFAIRRKLAQYVIESNSADETFVVDVRFNTENFAIQPDDTVTRIKLTAVADYRLGESASGKVTTITGYNATTSQFATSVSRRDALEKAADDLALKLLTRIRLLQPA